ncbi:hypothetical protein QE152_g24864 [Popillia japonica]|uniref:Uncharacterized protein n=1 Tax=Popillia japonica TaxID=7064 RepID=A0AAW1K4K1_POPJA
MAKRPRTPSNKDELVATVTEEWLNIPEETINNLIDSTPSNKDELVATVTEEWLNIPEETINNLIDSIPRRIATLYASKGGSTNY